MSESSITPTLGTSPDLRHTQFLSFKGKDEAPNENQKKIFEPQKLVLYLLHGKSSLTAVVKISASRKAIRTKDLVPVTYQFPHCTQIT